MSKIRPGAMSKIRKWVANIRQSKKQRDIERTMKQQREVRREVVDAELRKQKEQVKKVLLLGAGEVGKATMFKQYNHLFGQGYADIDRDGFRTPIYHNALSVTKQILQQININLELMRTNVLAGHRINALRIHDEHTHPPRQQLVDDVKALWKDPAVQRVYARRYEMQLLENMDYWVGKFEEVAKPSYTPSYLDLLYCRLRTTGIVEASITVDSQKSRVILTGGQRNERKKWIHCFEEVSVVVFVVNMGGYDHALYEDESTCRLVEDIALFDEIVNSRWFGDTTIVLILNMRDIFKEKLKKSPFATSWFCRNRNLRFYEDPRWSENERYERAVDFITNAFWGVDQTAKVQNTFVTCMVNEDEIEDVISQINYISGGKAVCEGVQWAVSNALSELLGHAWPSVLTDELMKMLFHVWDLSEKNKQFQHL